MKVTIEPFKQYTGKEFNQYHNGGVLCKFLRDNLTDYSVTYKKGLNKESLPFELSNQFSHGSIHFFDESNLHIYAGLHYGNNLALIEIPDDACVYVGQNLFKADKITVKQIVRCDEMGDDFWIKMIHQNGCVIEYIKHQTLGLCKLAVQLEGLALQFIKPEFKTPEICELAVRECGYALRYVENQTDTICKLAVQQNGGALQYVIKQTDEICRLAIQQNDYATQFVKK